MFIIPTWQYQEVEELQNFFLPFISLRNLHFRSKLPQTCDKIKGIGKNYTKRFLEPRRFLDMYTKKSQMLSKPKPVDQKIIQNGYKMIRSFWPILILFQIFWAFILFL